MDILNLLQVYQFDKKYRCGVNGDGGYVIGELDGQYDCYISAGISDEDSFSRDFIAKYGFTKKNSYAFDGTISDYPYHYTREITFVKKNIGAINDDFHTNLSDIMDNYQNIFLKIDIEGGEYPWIMSLDERQLNKFRQIAIEFHGITNDCNSWGCNRETKLKCIEKLTNTHYIIHAHGNNYASVKNGIPDVIELTCIAKREFQTPPDKNRTPLPIPNIDFPNTMHAPDIQLNHPPFTV
jgi:hypothetical protein